jgi:hypothetical protein
MNHAMMQSTSSASAIMLNFATSTGLTVSSHKPRRYLWTDAFAVCNFLGLYRKTGESAFLRLALNLVDQVHQVHGRFRSDGLSAKWNGQYFHYLMKWMHALNCVSRDTGEDIYNQWALELAKVANAAFTYAPSAGGARRMLISTASCWRQALIRKATSSYEMKINRRTE